jgi:SAM-dependent methyltransferase
MHQLTADFGLERKRLQVVLDAAVAMEMLALEDDMLYGLTELGRDLAKNRGFFTWAIGGYAPLLEAMGTFMADPAVPSLPYVRSEDVAIGSDECNQGLMEPIFRSVIDRLPVKRVADLGCGNAGRLVSLLERRPELTGVGIDIAPQAIQVAGRKRDEHQLKQRLHLVQEDVFQALAEPRPEFQDVELVMSFMMLHDLFNISDLKDNLFTRLKAAFPQAKYFVFADTCLDGQERTAATMPIFAMGFELVHALRGIDVFPLEYYQERFAKSGLKLAGQYKFGAPNTYIFVLEV